MYTYYYWPAYT